MHTEQQNILAHNQKLEREIKEMTKRSANFEKMYRALKAQQINPHVEAAAEHDADNVIHGASQNPAGQYRGSQQQQPAPSFQRRQNSNGSGGSDERRRMTLQPGTGYGGQGYAPPGSRMGMTSSRKCQSPLCCENETEDSQIAPQCHPLSVNVFRRIYLSRRLVRTTPASLVAAAEVVILIDKEPGSMAAIVVVIKVAVQVEDMG